MTMQRPPIKIWGVKQNNLKNINIEIPLGSMTVVCGPSGSGKSSLAFETLYAEGQRRYIESLSHYEQQFLNKSPKPDIEGIANIPPAIAIDQKNHVKSSHSTVGTVSEITDYFRLLYEKVGQAYCPNDKNLIQKDTPSSATQTILKKWADKRIYILAPIFAKQRIADGKKLLQVLIEEGYLRAFFLQGEKLVDLDASSKLPKEDFFIVIDRLKVDAEEQGRLSDSVTQAFQASLKFNSQIHGGRIKLFSTEGEWLSFTEEFSCSICDYTLPPVSSKFFSFTSPLGACPTCKGFGNLMLLDQQKVIPYTRMSIAEGAILPLTFPSGAADKRELKKFCEAEKIDLHTPWADLPQKQRDLIWLGHNKYDGIKGIFDYLEQKKYKMHIRIFLARFKSPFECPDCKGTRLRPETEQVVIDDKSITDIGALSLEALQEWVAQLKLTRYQQDVSKEVLRQIKSRLHYLIEVGLGYLSMDRATKTLSGGEYQRLTLANQLGMELSQTLYVLDEPTIGLHPRDNDRLISIIHRLKDLGNTLVIVEHDPEMIKAAEYVIEIGPGSGKFGGEVIFTGEKAQFYHCKTSITVPYLLQKPKPDTTATSFKTVGNKLKKDESIEILGCSENNLKNIDVKIPLNQLVVITGVSGSGKSTLVGDTLYPAFARAIGLDAQVPGAFKKIRGDKHIEDIQYLDQTGLGRSARSNPVTYLKIYDEIRNLMASTDEAKRRGYTPSFFSFNVDGGRCPACKGEGFQTIDMMFMDDIYIICDTCDGKRFQRDLLEVHYHGKNIDDILKMTVTEGLEFFGTSLPVRRALTLMRDVGLEYLQLGQTANTLSGGEAQRMRIARELLQSKKGRTLYILDEPTTGLHFKEVKLLVAVLRKLIEAGNSVVVVEHNLEVIRNAEYVIELGPDAGKLGGEILFEGSPRELSKFNKSFTAHYLKPYFT